MYPEEEQIIVIKNYLVQALDPFLIMLFGSAAAGQLRQDSDFDIAFLSDREMDSYQLFMLSQQLADLIGREVHLIASERIRIQRLAVINALPIQ